MEGIKAGRPSCSLRHTVPVIIVMVILVTTILLTTPLNAGVSVRFDKSGLPRHAGAITVAATGDLLHFVFGKLDFRAVVIEGRQFNE